MALLITCPRCGTKHRLSDPYPPPGAELQCSCGNALAISYGVGQVESLRARGARFQDDPAPSPAGAEDPTVFIGGQAKVDPSTISGDWRAASARPEAPSPAKAQQAAPPAKPPVKPPPPPPVPPAAKAAKKPTSWIARIFQLGVFLVLLGGVAIVGVFTWFGQELPSLESLQVYRPPTVTVVKDRKGNVLGEIYEQRRYVAEFVGTEACRVEAECIPEHVREAFLAAEDANFYNHQGVDPMGILRAMGRNLSKGKMAQGASTITQQVARNFLLTSEKKLSRKIKEVILARRIEDALEKDRILWLYLNQIYLGSGAYGVEAASRVYFDKHVGEITLAEAAVLAGLPQRPSDYSPHRNWESARNRQEYVLDQMREKGFITKEEEEAALAEQVGIVKKENPIRILAPTFTEHVRRYLVDTYGFERVYNDGLVVTTTADLELQQTAQKAVVEGVTRMDQALGWRGPIEHIEAAAIPARREAEEKAMREQDQFLADNARRGPLPDKSSLRVGERFEAVIIAVEKGHAIVGVGEHEAIIPLSWTKWAFPPNPDRNWKYRAQDDLSAALKVGDVVTVEIAALDSQTEANLKGYGPAIGKAAARLTQPPELQGALLSFDLQTGAVTAMVGGIDIEKSEYNRAIQAQRQVGSTFKPFVYAAAIESRKLTAGSMLLDAPLAFFDSNEGKMWKPGNYGEDFLGNITMRRALAMSRNTCTVRVMDVIGMEIVVELAHRLGVESHLETDLSVGLGSGSLTLLEMTRAYSAFATYGTLVQPYYIEKVEDRDGKVLEEHQAAPFPEVLDPAVAGIANWLLRNVTTSGTAAKTQKMGLHLAGKTGTTNDFKDAWFVGYSPGVMTGTWVGYDQPRSMGQGSTGGDVALPIWMTYMEKAWPKAVDRDFPPIPGAVYAGVDESSGRIAVGGTSMPFLPGTIPDGPVGEVGQVSAEDFMTGGF